ncbi:MAG: alpha/beta fold hydrolase [Alphaproteobacteria bacterium]|nr:alpha/beta fold hydrolase [Alphaproteobacteria bacterium]
MEPSPEPDRLDVRGHALSARARGRGPVVLMLHGAQDAGRWSPCHDLLSQERRVVAPVHPGFAATPRASGIETVEDLAYLYLDLVEANGWRDVHLVGAGLGGWIAAEMLVRSCARFARLVLIDAVGIKISPPDMPDILDTYAMGPDDRLRALFRDAEAGRRILGDPRHMVEAALDRYLHDEEADALYAWKPFQHNPSLHRRLYRIGVPTLVLWGENDRVVSTGYGRAFAAAIPGARFEIVLGAGHLPHLERPEAAAAAIAGFLTAPSAGRAR